jgi:uncharacterized protein YkwD
MKALKIVLIGFFLTILIGCTNQPDLKKENIQKAASTLNNNDKLNYSFKLRALNYINTIRANGTKCSPPAPPLRLNKNLEDAANAHAYDMAMNNFLRHEGSGTQTDPAKPVNKIGSIFYERILFFGYPAKPYDLTGENITYTKITAKNKDLFKHFKKAVKIFLDDPPHCKIFMNPRFQDIGIGFFKTNKRYYWVLDYGERKN